MYLDRWRVTVYNLKNSMFSYTSEAPSCFPDPITDPSIAYCIQGLVFDNGKFPNGKFIHTSAVQAVYEEGGKLFAKTRNNVYELKDANAYFDCDIAENAAAKLGSPSLAEFSKKCRTVIGPQQDRLLEYAKSLICGETLPNDDIAENTLIICYKGTDPSGNKMFFKNDGGIVPVLSGVHVGIKVDSVGLAESEEKLEIWETLGRYYVDSEVMEFYDCDTESLLFYNMSDLPIYIIIYGNSAAMLCPPRSVKLASRKAKAANI